MARIVAGFGVPHNPNAPELVSRGGRGAEMTAKLYQAIADQVAQVELDVLVCFSSDHFNTFFLDNLPLLSVGVTAETRGPNDGTRMPRYTLPVHEALAGHIRAHGLQESFDLGVTQEFELDHSFLVPLHFLTPHTRIPIVPIFLAGIAAPLPQARRCYALGEMVRGAVAAWPDDLRVGVLGSGSFSLDIGGFHGAPREPGAMNSYPDPEWVDTVLRCLDHHDVPKLISLTTPEQMQRAGNVAGEILNWLAMLGAVGGHRANVLEPQPGQGHAYAAWRLG